MTSPLTYIQHPEFRRGIRDLAEAAVGVGAWGLMMGVAMVKYGLSIPEALFMSIVVFAGSSQMAATPLIMAGAPLWVIWATAFCVNLRFVVFSAHLRAYVMHLPLWQRLFSGYICADLSYVMLVKHHPKPGQTDEERVAQVAYLYGSCGINWLSWVSASVAGVALANVIPTQWGLGFAGILALVGITCSLASSRLRVVSALVAAAAAVLAFGLPLKLNILVAIAAATLACLALERLRAAHTRERDHA
jgi:predicted branched-subunit amino acid permease